MTRLYGIAWRDRKDPKYHGIRGQLGSEIGDRQFIPFQTRTQAEDYAALVQLRQETRIVTWVMVGEVEL